ncbi:MAG: DUF6057 family protein [Bacteroides sp.]|nr:DUF6057 family protein [Ruminococcus flavefaciens]MCM1554277.1 DUF6057 family protein [Bacteroides sp.]
MVFLSGLFRTFGSVMQALKKPAVWIYPLLAVGLWAFFAFAMPDVLEFWEKNQLFRFTSEYWHFFDHEPFGTLIYLHTFLIQFSYYPWLGAVVYALLFTLTAWLFNRCLTVNGNHRLLPGLVTVALLLPTTVNFGLLVLMVVFLTVLGAQLWMHWKNRVLRYGCQVIVLAALAYLVREYMAWVLPFFASIDYFRTKSEEKKFNFLLWLPTFGSALLWYFLERWMVSPYNFLDIKYLFTFGGVAFSPYDAIPYGYFRPVWVVFACIGVLAFFSLGWAFYHPGKGRFDWIIGLPLILGGIWFTLASSYPMQNFQKVDRLSRAYCWDEALHILDSQWENESKSVFFTGNSRFLFYTQTKLALLATRKATDRLFTYPQPAFPMLFPTPMNNRPECFSLPTYYTFVGCFSASLHLNYDLITCHCISANVLNATIVTSLMVDDTLPAFKLTHFLEKSLFYRSQAAIYKNADLRNELSVIKRGKQMLPSKNYTVLSYFPDNNASKEFVMQPQNAYLYEYLMSICLLNKLHVIVGNEIPSIRNLYPKDGTFTAPRHLQEALLASFDYKPSRYLYPQRIEGLSQDVWNNYWHFIADNQAYTNGTISFAELQRKWSHTYWFYDCYLKTIDTEATNHQSVN